MTGQDRFIAFEPLYERWGEYALPNGTFVRGRAVLTAILKGADGKGELRHAVQLESLGEEVGPPGSNEFREQDVVTTITDFQVLTAAQSLYRVKEGAVILHYQPKAFRLSGKNNARGEPLVQVQAGMGIEIIGSAATDLEGLAVAQEPQPQTAK